MDDAPQSDAAAHPPHPPAGRPLAPYRVQESGRSVRQVLAAVDDLLHQCYSSDLRLGGRHEKIVVGSLGDFERLLDGLRRHPAARFVTHRTLLSEPCRPDELRISFRHDVDADLTGALEQAKVEAEYDVPASWYMLHTAAYHGTFDGGVFHRNGCVATVYRQMQDLGHEIALHTDPLWVAQGHGIDGAAAVRTELEWMRSEGLDVVGTVAHNSKPVYGAWNYEIFTGRYDPKEPRPHASVPDWVEKDGVVAPLRVLDERELGLEYEGNEVFWRKDAPLEYGATRAVLQWRWDRHLARRRRGEAPGEPAFVDQDRMVHEIQSLPPGRDLVLVIHPCYYGARRQANRRPARGVNRTTRVVSPDLGWFVREPGTMDATAGTTPGDHFQTFNMANDDGMLDVPDRSGESVDVLLLGGTNVDGATVPISMQLHRRAMAVLAEGGTDAVIRKWAAPEMGAALLWPWLTAGLKRYRPSVVVVGIGRNVLRRAWTRAWGPELGVSPVHPPGDVLVAEGLGEGSGESTGEGEVVEPFVRRRDPAWALHRGTAWCPRQPLGSRTDITRMLVDERPNTPRGPDPVALVQAIVARLADTIDAAGARTVFLLEDAPLPADEHAALADLAARVGAPLVDPSADFAALPGGLPPVHAGPARRTTWNTTGHRVAGDALARELAIHLASGAPDPSSPAAAAEVDVRPADPSGLAPLHAGARDA